MCLYLGNLKMINFPFGKNGKLIVLGVPILSNYSSLIESKENYWSHGIYHEGQN